MLGAGRLASRLLRVVVKHLPAESQPWGHAILREMDFISSPWGMLSWSIGGASALFVYSVRLQVRLSLRETLGDIKRSGSKRTIGGLLSGLVMAGILLGLCVLSYFGLQHIPLPLPRSERLIDGTLIFLLPETAYLFAVHLLWRRRRSAALGVLLAAVILFTHVLIRHAVHS